MEPCWAEDKTRSSTILSSYKNYSFLFTVTQKQDELEIEKNSIPWSNNNNSDNNNTFRVQVGS